MTRTYWPNCCGAMIIHGLWGTQADLKEHIDYEILAGDYGGRPNYDNPGFPGLIALIDYNHPSLGYPALGFTKVQEFKNYAHAGEGFRHPSTISLWIRVLTPADREKALSEYGTDPAKWPKLKKANGYSQFNHKHADTTGRCHSCSGLAPGLDTPKVEPPLAKKPRAPRKPRIKKDV